MQSKYPPNKATKVTVTTGGNNSAYKQNKTNKKKRICWILARRVQEHVYQSLKGDQAKFRKGKSNGKKNTRNL